MTTSSSPRRRGDDDRCIRHRRVAWRAHAVLAALAALAMSVGVTGLAAAAVPADTETVDTGSASVHITSVDTSDYPTVALTVLPREPVADPAAFTVTQDGAPRPVMGAAPVEGPLEVALVVDTSEGMADHLRSVATAATDFALRLPADTEMAVVTAGGEAGVATAATDDAAAVVAALADLEAGGELALADAVALAVDELSAAAGARKAVVLVAGDEDGAPDATGDAVADLRGSGASLFAVSLGSTVVEELAASAGGSIHRVEDMAEVPDALLRAAGDLERLYRVDVNAYGGDAPTEIGVGIGEDPDDRATVTVTVPEPVREEGPGPGEAAAPRPRGDEPAPTSSWRLMAVTVIALVVPVGLSLWVVRRRAPVEEPATEAGFPAVAPAGDIQPREVAPLPDAASRPDPAPLPDAASRPEPAPPAASEQVSQGADMAAADASATELARRLADRLAGGEELDDAVRALAPPGREGGRETEGRSGEGFAALRRTADRVVEQRAVVRDETAALRRDARLVVALTAQPVAVAVLAAVLSDGIGTGGVGLLVLAAALTASGAAWLIRLARPAFDRRPSRWKDGGERDGREEDPGDADRLDLAALYSAAGLPGDEAVRWAVSRRSGGDAEGLREALRDRPAAGQEDDESAVPGVVARGRSRGSTQAAANAFQAEAARLRLRQVAGLREGARRIRRGAVVPYLVCLLPASVLAFVAFRLSS